MRRPDGLELGLVLVLWVVPLIGSVVFLAAVGLTTLALGLLVAELVVGGAVLLARRRPNG